MNTEKIGRLKNLSKLVCSQEKHIQDLRNRLAKATEVNGVRVGGDVHNDLVNIMNFNKGKHPSSDETFASIFWNQQLKSEGYQTDEMAPSNDLVVLVLASPIKWSILNTA